MGPYLLFDVQTNVVFHQQFFQKFNISRSKQLYFINNF